MSYKTGVRQNVLCLQSSCVNICIYSNHQTTIMSTEYCYSLHDKKSRTLMQAQAADSGFQVQLHVSHSLERFTTFLSYSSLHKNQWTKRRSLLKNLPPFFPITIPNTLDGRRDFVSGLHCNSLKTENKVESEGEISLSFIFLQDSTLRL